MDLDWTCVYDDENEAQEKRRVAYDNSGVWEYRAIIELQGLGRVVIFNRSRLIHCDSVATGVWWRRIQMSSKQAVLDPVSL